MMKIPEPVRLLKQGFLHFPASSEFNSPRTSTSIPSDEEGGGELVIPVLFRLKPVEGSKRKSNFIQTIIGNT